MFATSLQKTVQQLQRCTSSTQRAVFLKSLCSFSTVPGGRTSKLQQLLSKQSIKQHQTETVARNAAAPKPTLRAPSLKSPTSPVTSADVKAKGKSANTQQSQPWGIQMVLDYIRTQKVSKCVVFDALSHHPDCHYVVVLNVASTRAMYSLVERLSKQARQYKPSGFERFAPGKDIDGLWSCADMGSIVVHVMSEQGRATPSFQRVERRLVREAILVPVSKWHELKDGWTLREEKLRFNPPPQYDGPGIAPPGYYMRPDRDPVGIRIAPDSESEGEFGYYNISEEHRMKLEMTRRGGDVDDMTGIGSIPEYIDILPVEQTKRYESFSKNQARIAQHSDEEEDEDEDEEDEDDEDEDEEDDDDDYDDDDDDDDDEGNQTEGDYDVSVKTVHSEKKLNTYARRTLSNTRVAMFDDADSMVHDDDEGLTDITAADLSDSKFRLDSEGIVMNSDDEEEEFFIQQKKARGHNLEHELESYIDDGDAEEEIAYNRMMKDVNVEEIMDDDSEPEHLPMRRVK